MAIISKSDFVGVWLIPLNGVNDSFINSVIDYMEKKYLRMLLGDTLYLEFTAGLGVIPIASKWTDITDGKTLEYNDEKYIFEGVKPMLKSFIWAEYHNRTRAMSKPTGLAIPSIENGEVLNNADFGITLMTMYNSGVDSYQNNSDFLRMSNVITPDSYKNIKTEIITKSSW